MAAEVAVVVAAMARAHRGAMVVVVEAADAAPEPMAVAWTTVAQVGRTVELRAAMPARATPSPWTMRRATSVRAHRKTAAAQAAVLEAAITAAPWPIWAAALTGASRRVPRKVVSPTRCAPALT